MKINEAEQILGITKANIRFYEKEGLLTPSRNESGYRDYSDGDIARLKQIVILRKLGLPVQQIQEVLDGVLPLQEALEQNITSLKSQIDALSGSLALCQQLHLENNDTLDIDRCWDLIQSQEAAGLKFHTLVDDYLTFTEANYAWFLWPLPGESLRKPWKVAVYILVFSAVLAISRVSVGEAFLPAFIRQVLGLLHGFLLWTAIFIPIYLYSKRNPKTADVIMNILMVLPPILALLAIGIGMYLAFQ